MRRFLILVFVAIVSRAEATSPEVDLAEILRRGDLVTVTGEGARGAADDAIRTVTAPPADDSGMWHITVFSGGESCPACVQLLRDFESAPELACFVAAVEPAKAWAHFNVFKTTDRTQAWRVKQYHVDAVPTIAIQPPRNGSWGDPRTVVWQAAGYDGRPKELNRQITDAVRKYAAKMTEQGYPKRPNSLAQNDGGSGQKPVAVEPPFPTPPRVDPFHPQVVPQWPPQQPQATPTPNATDLLSELLSALLGGQGTGNFLILLLVGLRTAEFVVARTKTPIDDQVVAWLKQFATQRSSRRRRHRPLCRLCRRTASSICGAAVPAVGLRRRRHHHSDPCGVAVAARTKTLAAIRKTAVRANLGRRITFKNRIRRASASACRFPSPYRRRLRTRSSSSR